MTNRSTDPQAEASASASRKVTHVVLRIIEGAEGGDIFGGTPEEPVLVDASEWANTLILEQSRHLRRATLEEIEAYEASQQAALAPVFSIVGAVPPAEVETAIVLHLNQCECEDKVPEGWGVIEPFDAKSRVEIFEALAGMTTQPAELAECLIGVLADLPKPTKNEDPANPLAGVSKSKLKKDAKAGDKAAQAELDRRAAAAAKKAGKA